MLDTGLIGEGVLQTMRDATRRLLAPGGQLVPSSATVYAMAVELREPEVDGLDFSCLASLYALQRAPTRDLQQHHPLLPAAPIAEGSNP